MAALSSSAVARSSGQRLRTGGAVLQLAPDDLAGAAARQFIENRNAPWHFVIREIFPNVRLECVRCGGGAVGEDDERCQSLSVLLVVDAEYRGLATSECAASVFSTSIG